MRERRNLCCCEYVSENGEINHILACCCNCVSLDEMCDSILCCKKMPSGSWNRFLGTVADRIRIPYCDGQGALKLSKNEITIILCSIFPPLVIIFCSQDHIYVFISVVIFFIPLLLFGSVETCFTLCFTSMTWLLLFMQFVILPQLRILFSEHFVLMLGVSSVCALGYYVRTQKCSACFTNECIKRNRISAWLSCCVADKRFYSLFLFFVFITCIFYADLALTSACNSWVPSQPVKNLFLLPFDCSYVYQSFTSSISFTSGLYALVVAVTALVSCVRNVLCRPKRKTLF